MDNLLARISDQETATFNTEGLLNFIRLLRDRMVERFPEGEVQDWVAFDCAALKFPFYAFGITRIEALWSKYQSVLPKSNVIIEQYTDFKYAMAEKIEAGVVSTLADLIKFVFQLQAHIKGSRTGPVNENMEYGYAFKILYAPSIIRLLSPADA